MRFLAVLVLCVPLAGCFSLVAPKEVPEWAMQPQAAYVDEPHARPQRSARVRRPIDTPLADRAPVSTPAVADASPTNTQPAALGHSVVRRKPTSLSPAADTTAFSPEWHAREEARDVDLKRSMGNICRGC